MTRHLDDYGVGEYKSNWWWTLVYALVVLAGVVAVFLLPCSDEYLSPVNYLIKYKHNGAYSITSVAYISLFGIALINVFLCNNNFKIAKSIYCKIARVLELLACLSCVVVYGITILNESSIESMEFIRYMFSWFGLSLIVVVLSLINYFKVKKISIYD